MTRAAFTLELRLRARLVMLAAVAMIALAAAVGALYPAFGDAIGDLSLPQGVGDLIGGGDLSSLAGWLKTEVVSISAPAVAGGIAITCAAATIAGEEEGRILALVLAHPVRRTDLLLAKAAAITLIVAIIAIATWVGLLLGVALAGGGIGPGLLAAQSLHLAFLSLALGALALAIGAATGQRAIASGGAAAVAVVMFLVNGFAPAISSIAWMKYLTLFHYYSGHDPLTSGVNVADLAVLAATAAALTVAAIVGLRHRDLRA